MRTRRIGFVIFARKFLTVSSSANDSIEPLIIERPTKSMPKPAIMPPTFLTVSFFAKALTNAPMPAKVAKIVPVDTALSNIPRAVI